MVTNTHIGFDNFGERIFSGDKVRKLEDIGIDGSAEYIAENNDNGLIVVSLNGVETTISENKLVCL